MSVPVLRIALLACATLFVVPAAAGAAAPKKVTYPVIKKVTPLKLRIGDTLTITGTGFRSGKGRNTVVFKRDGKPAVFAMSGKSTTKKLTVVVPDKLTPFLATK
jgi:hypothetical protein